MTINTDSCCKNRKHKKQIKKNTKKTNTKEIVSKNKKSYSHIHNPKKRLPALAENDTIG